MARAYLALLHKLVCVICLHCYGKIVAAAEAHHLESVRGEHSDFAAAPICQSCHHEIHHRSRRAFYLAHGLDDIKLLAFTAELVYRYLTASDEDRESGEWARRMVQKPAGRAAS